MAKNVDAESLDSAVIDVIIPAFNEQNAVGRVIDDLPMSILRHVIVCDNGSTDNTTERAKSREAIVVRETRKGYGSACLKALRFIGSLKNKPDIVVFLDADYSDYPEELPILVEPIIESNFDMVIGSRILGNVERGSLTIPQRFGNRLATFFLRKLYNAEFTDLGPFRAIRYDKLLELNMKDPDYGWTVEMQIKAATQQLKFTERAVSYRKRIGKSKVSGTIQGVFGAGSKILGLIFWYGIMKRK